MCKFLSAIVLKNGDILYNQATDSHEDLVALHNLRDNREGNFARAEFFPDKASDLDKPDKYQLNIDESITPDWLTDELKGRVSEHLRSVVSRMIVDGDATCLIGGTYVLTGGAKVGFTKAVRIVAMLGTSQVGAMWDTSRVPKGHKPEGAPKVGH